MPESLPKLLLSVKWNSRDEVSQVPSAVAMSPIHFSADLTSNPPIAPSSSSDVLPAEGVASDGARISSGAVGLQLPRSDGQGVRTALPGAGSDRRQAVSVPAAAGAGTPEPLGHRVSNNFNQFSIIKNRLPRLLVPLLKTCFIDGVSFEGHTPLKDTLG